MQRALDADAGQGFASPTAVFVPTGLPAAPFCGLTALAHGHVLGGPGRGAVCIAAVTVTPAAAAAGLTVRRRGMRGLRARVGRGTDLGRSAGRRRYFPGVLVPPLPWVPSVAWMLLLGAPLPPAMAPAATHPAVFAVLALLAAGEEIGWTGYAAGPLQARHGALRAALRPGVARAAWHVPFFVVMLADPLVPGAGLVALVGPRVLIFRIFNAAGKSVLAAILYHAADNTAFVILPDLGASLPWGPVIVCGHVVAAAAAVTLLWGPRTQTGDRSPKASVSP